MNNACPLRITAAAGTKLAGTKLLKYVSLFIFTKVFYKTKPSLSHKKYCWIRQIAHCPRFLTAASKEFGPFSFPMWLSILPDQLNIVGLVGFNPANNLIFHRCFNKRKRKFFLKFNKHCLLNAIMMDYQNLLLTISYELLTRTLRIFFKKILLTRMC